MSEKRLYALTDREASEIKDLYAQDGLNEALDREEADLVLDGVNSQIILEIGHDFFQAFVGMGQTHEAEKSHEIFRILHQRALEMGDGLGSFAALHFNERHA